jgi:hypothetical protein
MESDAPANRVTALNGGTLAAVMAAGIGAFAMGMFVILNEAGLYTAPSLYGPAGGLSGRSTFAVAAWLVAWGILHARWKDRALDAGRVLRWTLLLVALALVLTFPPVWTLL